MRGKIIRVEAHPIPSTPRRVQGRVTLVGDAAGYVTGAPARASTSPPSPAMAAEAVVERSQNGTKEARVRLRTGVTASTATTRFSTSSRRCSHSNPAREAFVEMCADEYVQKMTFDSYLYKTVVPGNL